MMFRQGIWLLLWSALLLSPASHATASQPSPWENEIRAFEASDRTNPPPKGATLFVGSSSIRLWTNLAQSFPHLTTIRRGFGGSHIPDSTALADRIILPYRPSKIVFYAGENDIARGDSPQQVLTAFKEFVQKIEKELPNTPIYFVSIKPAPVRWHLSPQEREANRLIRNYCRKDKHLRFVDVWSAMLDATGQPKGNIYRQDNLHMNAQGYAIWTDILTKVLGE